MKKVLIGLGCVILVLACAVIALPFLIPAGDVQDQMIAAVKRGTGRDLVIMGKVTASVFPNVAVKASDVMLANPSGYATPTMIHIDSLDVRLKFLPLLAGRVQVDSFVLAGPQVGLEIDRQGRPNWIFASQPAPGAAAPGNAAQPAPVPAARGGNAGAYDLRLGDVRVTNGILTYRDDRTNSESRVDGINLALSLPGLDNPLSAKGSLTWRGKPVTVSVDIATPRQLMNGKMSVAAITVSSDPVKLSLKGAVSAAPAAKGDVELTVPSVRDLVQWLTAAPLAAPGTGLGPLAIAGQIAATPVSLAFTGAKVGLDKMNMTGDIALTLNGPRPALKGKLGVDDLDLNAYLPPPAKAGGNGGTPGGAPAPAQGGAAAAGWSTDPIDASALRLADADLTFSAGKIEMRDIKIGQSALHLVVSGGKLTADLSQLTLYGGSGKGHVVLDGTGSGVGIDATVSLQGVQAQPLLADAAGFERLSGTANGDMAITGHGANQRDIVGSLGGKCTLAFRNGAIKGIDLAAMIKNVGSAFSQGSGGQTEFGALTGTCAIANGIVTNKDLVLQSQLFKINGAGTADLPSRSLDYRLEPKLAGAVNLADVTVPVIVSGPWDNLSYRPDLAGAAKDAIGKAITDQIPSLPLKLFGK